MRDAEDLVHGIGVLALLRHTREGVLHDFEKLTSFLYERVARLVHTDSS